MINGVIKSASKISNIIAGIGFTLVGLVILAISVLALVNHKEFEGKTTATIVNIQAEKIDDFYTDSENLNQEEYNYTVFVSYEVDGKQYHNIQYDSYDSSMQVGQTIEVQYDLNDPSKIQGSNGTMIAIIFVIIGSLATIFGVYMTIKGFKLNKDNAMYNVMKN